MFHFRVVSKMGVVLAVLMVVGGSWLMANPNQGPLFRPNDSAHSRSFVDRTPSWGFEIFGVFGVLAGIGVGLLSFDSADSE
jgi:hypothetical protein